MDFFDFIKNNKLIILIFSIIINILLVFIACYFLFKNLNYECVCENNNLAVNNESNSSDIKNFYVEINGDVVLVTQDGINKTILKK